MKLVSGTSDTEHGRAVAHWFGTQVEREQHGPYAAMGWQDDRGQFCSAIIFHDYNGANIELHMIGRVTRAVIREGFRYAFVTLKCLRITAKPYRDAVKVREGLVKLGFVAEGSLANYYGPGPEQDAIVYRLDPLPAQKWMT